MNFISKYKSDFRQNTSLAMPLIIGQLGQVTVYVADNIMVGRLGATELASVSLSTAIFGVFLVLGMGISFALPPLVSEAHGARNFPQISRYFKHSLITNIGIGLLFMVILLFGVHIVDYLGQEPTVALLAKDYLFFAAISILPMMIFLTLRNYSDGMSNTKPSMIAMVVGNLFNILFNYIFIFGKFGMPAYGVAGASFASLLARVIMVVVLLGLIYYKKDLWIHIAGCNFKRYTFPLFKKIFNLGVPSSLQMFFEISAFAGAAIIMGMVGKNEQAAHQVAINLASITFMVCTGFAMASTIRVGNQLGQKNYQKMQAAGISVLLQIAFIMSFCSFIFFIFRHQLPWIYISDTDVVEIAATLLIFAAIFQIPDGIQVAALASLRGLQDVYMPTMITFISYYIFGIPISYFAAIKWNMGASGVWLGLLVGLFVSASLLTFRFVKLSNLQIENAK